jgi:4-amino-4-deoxy-L-arabinose transferase-like glycosyltransferase
LIDGRLSPRPVGPASLPGSLILFVAAITVFRLWAAAAIPLSEDEAYYRLWAASLQFGYYDHPPMIAWWIWAGQRLAGDTALGLRLIPVLSCALTSLLVFDLAGRLGASRASAARAAVWYNATLLIGAGGVLATPDAAAVPFWTLTLWCLVRAEAPNGGRWWLAAGAAAGLGCLSKYSALFLAPGVFAWLLFRPGGLAALRKPWPWLAAGVAAVLFSTNVVWNAEHHWVSFAKQFGRVAPGRWAPQYLVEFAAGQIVLLNPLIAGFAVAGVAGGWRRREDRPDLRSLAASALPFAAYLALHALHDRVQAHWPAPLYPSLAILAAVAAERLGAHGPAAVARRVAAPLGLGLSALILIHAALPATDVKGLRDPVASLRGWPAFAGQVDALRLARHADWVGSFSYGTSAQLAAQPSLRAPSLELIERGRYPAADASWRVDVARPGLVVDLDRRLDPAVLARCFAVVTPAGPLTRGDGGDPGQHYAAYRVAGAKARLLRDGC